MTQISRLDSGGGQLRGTDTPVRVVGAADDETLGFETGEHLAHGLRRHERQTRELGGRQPGFAPKREQDRDLGHRESMGAKRVVDRRAKRPMDAHEKVTDWLV
jgi:hypothetical protein